MSTVGKKALLVATWGLPLTWICVRYIPPRLEAGELCRRPIDCGYDQQGKYSFSSTSVIYDELRRGGWDVRVLVISQDTLVAKCQEGAGRQGSQGRAGPQGQGQCSGECNEARKREVDDEYCSGNAKLFEEVKGSGSVDYMKLVEWARGVLGRYARVLLGDDVDSRLSIVVLPGSGYYSGYRFENPLENARFTLMRELYDELRSYEPDAVILDITHGVNYMPAMTYSTAMTLARVLYAARGSPRYVVTLNSDPVTQQLRCSDIRVNVVDVVDMDKEGVTIGDALREIGEFEGTSINILVREPATTGDRPMKAVSELRKGDESVRQLSRKYIGCLGNALDYGMIIYMAASLTQRGFDEFVKLVSDKVNGVYEAIRQLVNVKYEDGYVVVSRNYAANSDLVLQYVATGVLNHVKGVVEGCRVNDGYDLNCLRDAVESLRIGNLARTIFENEVNNITVRYADYITGEPRLLCSVMDEECGECSSVDKRNLIAHAGLEKTVTHVYRWGGRVLVKYAEKCLGKIEANTC